MAFVRPRALSTTPTVSVVVPCYNYGGFLADAVSSALNQRHVDVDVLIVDDASTDGSADVARTLAEADPRVTLLCHEQNLGHIATYNEGLAKARGMYVVLLSADDLLTPDALTRAASLMERHRSVGFVYGFASQFQDRPPEVSLTARSWSVWDGMTWLRLAARRGRNFVSSPAVVMRREAMQEVGLYDPRLPHAGDFDMWLRTAVGWDVGRVNGAVQALYRVHGANMSLTTYADKLTDLCERRRTFEILCDERAPNNARLARLRQGAMRRLGREALRQALWAHIEGVEPRTIEEYLDYALRTYPGARSGILWRLCELGPLSGRRPPSVAGPRMVARRVRRYFRLHTWP